MIARAVMLVILMIARMSAAAETDPCVDAGLVMVRATYDDSHIERGAGIVVKVDDVHTYVVTARHVVVERGAVSKVEVGFRADSPAMHAAEILVQSDSDDWAVLDVGVPAKLRPSDLCPLGATDALQQGNHIHYVGQPTEPLVSWAVAEGQVTNFGVSRVMFVATAGEIDVGRGFSGGGLYDQDWHLVGMIVSANGRAGIALSARGIVQALATSEKPIASDLDVEAPPHAVLVAVGAAGTYGGDPYIHHRVVPMTAEALVELVGWPVGSGRLMLMLGVEGSLAILSRTTTLSDFPGAPAMTGTKVHEYLLGGVVPFRAQLQCSHAALFVDVAPGYVHLSESDNGDGALQLVLAAGASFRPVGPISIFARARVSVQSQFTVPDYRFTLSGQPGTIDRPIDTPWLFVVGAEYRIR